MVEEHDRAPSSIRRWPQGLLGPLSDRSFRLLWLSATARQLW